MRNLNHAAIEPYISTPRLDAYRHFFNPVDDVALLGAYQWNKEVAGAFFPLLQTLEITLRNAIHGEASKLWGQAWFDNVQTKARPTPAQQRHTRQHGVNISKARQALGRRASPDRIVAMQTLGFWTNLFNEVFDVNGQPRALWPTLLQPVFPHATRVHRQRDPIRRSLVKIQRFRNRAFHHEPLWKHRHPANPHQAIQNLLDMVHDVAELIGWISTDTTAYLRAAGYIENLNRVISVDHLNYLQTPGNDSLPLAQARRTLRKLVSSSPGIQDITRRGERVARLIT
ncbi:hypothetical protein FHR99_003205 [Litorivivens lipolytica]|uniref:Abi-like protein n=1 Tax=Litorivivens lipolytica TaxID=1524264 RepID=A0A7W4Z8G3_9GAMM|nr:Abi family protein [Litorivivens lipolytica]MBB3048931.1 hypothetical protein [Litorivivens lipolytica]